MKAELMVSLETVEKNAKRFKSKPEEELLRVLIHGVLHLCGYKDKTELQIKKMRNKENYYLNKIKHAGKNY